MITKELIQRMEAAFSDREAEFSPEEITELPAKNFAGQRVGTIYAVNRGEIPYSRGQLESYVYIEYNDGETVTQQPDTEQEFKLWTVMLAS